MFVDYAALFSISIVCGDYFHIWVCKIVAISLLYFSLHLAFVVVQIPMVLSGIKFNWIVYSGAFCLQSSTSLSIKCWASKYVCVCW